MILYELKPINRYLLWMLWVLICRYVIDFISRPTSVRNLDQSHLSTCLCLLPTTCFACLYSDAILHLYVLQDKWNERSTTDWIVFKLLHVPSTKFTQHVQHYHTPPPTAMSFYCWFASFTVSQRACVFVIIILSVCSISKCFFPAVLARKDDILTQCSPMSLCLPHI